MPWEKQFDVDAVLDRAMQQFWSRGYEATSMQELVACTGINRASLYATYGDKHSLFLAALRRYEEKTCADLLADLEARHEPREAIRQLFLAFTKIPERGAPRGCFLTNTALELAAHDPEIGTVVAHGQQAIETFLARMVRNGKAAAAIGEHVKPAETARSLLASLIGVVVLSRSRPEPTLLRTIVDDALRRLD